MGRSCSVPNCRSNYDSKQAHVNTFSFPKGDTNKSLELRIKWLKSINRDNWTPGKNACVCILHFSEQFIVREDVMTRPDGSVLRVPRDRVVLKEGAFPTIFKSQPSYLSVELPAPRTDPKERRARIEQACEDKFEDWMASDIIHSFEYFKKGYKDKMDDKWTPVVFEDSVHFIKYNPVSFKADICIKITCDLDFVVHHNARLLPQKHFSFMATKKQYLCDRWSKFENLLKRLINWNVEEVSFEECVEIVISVVLSCIKKLQCQVCENHCGGVCSSDSGDSEEKNVVWKKLMFIHEQLDLLLSKRPSYSPETLIWAFTLHLLSPSGYCNLRDTQVLTLPHPKYLQKFSQRLGGLNESGLKAGHVQYLTEKCKKLDEREKLVNVIFDEIHVKSQITFKGGQVEGQSLNCSEEATAVQAFMISSLYSKNRDVVALFPVKNQNGDQLFELIKQILSALHQSGYLVFSLISDNHQINRLAFSLMGGQFSVRVANPVVPGEFLFLIPDNVHLLKNIRNNWFNQEDQSFEFPNFDDFSIIEVASVKDLINLYRKETNNVIKQAPALCQKVLFPTPTERQNVSHAVKVFDEKTIAALDKIKEAWGTMKFLKVIATWWKIVNVKCSYKGNRHRDPYQNHIESNTCDGYKFLIKFEQWLKAWKCVVVQRPQHKAKGKCPRGKLSNETHSALSNSTRALIEICDERLNEVSVKYVLLGKFQSDNIERRFGLYRQLSGSCYHVSVSQVLESERKLKVLSLLKLQSATKGAFALSDVLDTCSVNFDGEVDDKVEATFQSVISDSDYVDVPIEQIEALIFVGGYVGKKALHNNKCGLCKDFLLDSSKQLSLDNLPNNDGSYLRIIDRGGLTYPTEFTMNICLSALQVFQTLIGNMYEEEFLAASCQKKILIKLVMKSLHSKDIILEISCECGVGMSTLAQKCCNTLANILLNNYTKLHNDRINLSRGSNKRKLGALNAF